MAMSSVVPRLPQASRPAGRRAQAGSGRQPLLLWPPVVTAVVGSLILIAVFFMILPPRRALATATAEGLATESTPNLPAPEQIPAPARVSLVPVSSAPTAKLADNIPTAVMAKAPAAPAIAAEEPRAAQVDVHPFAFIPETPVGNTACNQYGTKVDFYDTPTLAAGHAVNDQKLLFVLHVAGNFEEPGFT